MKKVSVIVIGFNSKDYLESCLQSVYAQDSWNREVIFIDNASSDGSVEFVSEHFPETHVMGLEKNLGYAAANNIGINLSKGDYILTLNPDVVLQPGYLAICVDIMETRSELAGVQGKLLRMYSAEDESANLPLNQIDSTGDFIYKDRHVISRGQGEEDNGQYDKDTWVFSLTGAAAVFRKSALEDCKVGHEYFDEDFFAYKEDIDLCWRARLLGWEFAYVPQAIGYHARGWGSKKYEMQNTKYETNLKNRYQAISQSRSEVSPFLKFHSFKNRHLMMMKNEVVGIFLLHLPWIIFFETGILLFAALKERFVLKAWKDILALKQKMKQKRVSIVARKKVTNRQVRKWFK